MKVDRDLRQFDGLGLNPDIRRIFRVELTQIHALNGRSWFRRGVESAFMSGVAGERPAPSLIPPQG